MLFAYFLIEFLLNSILTNYNMKTDKQFKCLPLLRTLRKGRPLAPDNKASL